MNKSWQTGRQGAYYWIVWETQLLANLIQAVPEIVLGKYLITSSFDSSPYTPSPEEIRQGWYTENELTYSTTITDVADLSYTEYSEWYIYPRQPKVEGLEVFINYSSFKLQYDESQLEMNELLKRFWTQLAALAPESYLAEGDYLIFATRDVDLFERIRARLAFD